MEIYVRVLVRSNNARRQERNINYAPENESIETINDLPIYPPTMSEHIIHRILYMQTTRGPFTLNIDNHEDCQLY